MKIVGMYRFTTIGSSPSVCGSQSSSVLEETKGREERRIHKYNSICREIIAPEMTHKLYLIRVI